MAKQLGIHQIRGKVGGRSYYKTKGVEDGISRSINQGMSARVKTADEYANTRLNNAEFKNGNKIASFLLNAVPNRRASMMRSFAVALMTKQALEYIKDGSGQWGARIPSIPMDGIALDLLENFAKGGSYQGEFGIITVTEIEGTYALTLNADSATGQALADKGIDGFYALTVKGALAEIIDDDGFVRQHFGKSSINPVPVGNVMEIEDMGLATFIPSAQTLGMSPAGFLAAQEAENNGMYAIVTFLPYRQVGTQRHTLYEYATYATLALGAIPTE